MALRAAATCLVALLLAPQCLGAGAKAKVKAKDPWDVPDGGSEEFQAAPEGAMEDEEAPEQQESIMQRLAERRAKRGASNQHAVMKQFMSTFANNMRLSVLADSKGDMPEERRQELIAKAEAQKQASEGGDGGFAPTPQEAEAEASEEMPEPPPQRRAPRHRMLNMAERRQHRAQHHASHRLLPEAEGIGFPAPEGMASDPATDGMSNDPGSTSFGSAAAEQEEAPQEYEAPAPRTRPLPHRHHLHMLNMRPGEPSQFRHHHQPRPAVDDDAPQMPPGVVADEMGRKMPLLSFGGPPAHSGASHFALTSVAAMGIACLFFTEW